MTNNISFERKQISIGPVNVDVFFNLESGEFSYSQTSLASAIGKSESSTRSYLDSKSFKAKYGKDFTPATFRDNKTSVKLLPAIIATDYFLYWAGKGDNVALDILGALATESLELRAKRAFNQLTVESYDATVEKTNTTLENWLAIREQTKNIHPFFINAYQLKGHPGCRVHDLITQLVNGMTAAEARQGQIVDESLNPSIGLNYVSDDNKLAIIALAKDYYCLIRKGNWQEQSRRAVDAAMKEIRAAGLV